MGTSVLGGTWSAIGAGAGAGAASDGSAPAVMVPAPPDPFLQTMITDALLTMKALVYAAQEQRALEEVMPAPAGATSRLSARIIDTVTGFARRQVPALFADDGGVAAAGAVATSPAQGAAADSPLVPSSRGLPVGAGQGQGQGPGPGQGPRRGAADRLPAVLDHLVSVSKFYASSSASSRLAVAHAAKAAEHPPESPSGRGGAGASLDTAAGPGFTAGGMSHAVLPGVPHTRSSEQGGAAHTGGDVPMRMPPTGFAGFDISEAASSRAVGVTLAPGRLQPIPARRGAASLPETRNIGSLDPLAAGGSVEPLTDDSLLGLLAAGDAGDHSSSVYVPATYGAPGMEMDVVDELLGVDMAALESLTDEDFMMS